MGGRRARSRRPGGRERVTHLLVTNDFPPKVGGIQAYLWELWRRFDPDTFAVLTASSHPDAAAFDREQAARGIRIERVSSRVLLPTPRLARRIRGRGPAGRRRPGRHRPRLPPRRHRPPPGHSLRCGAARGRVGRARPVAAQPPGRCPRAAPERDGRLGRRLPGHRGPASPAGQGDAADGRDPTRRRPRPIPAPDGDGAGHRPVRPRPPRRRTAGGEREPARAAQGDGRPHRRGGATARRCPEPDRGYRRSRARLGPVGREGGRAHRSGTPARRGRAMSTCPGWSVRPTCSPCSAATAGSGSSRRGSASCFLEAAAAGIPQIVGASGGATEAVRHGETGLVVRRPTDTAAVVRAIRRLLDDPGAAFEDGGGGTASGRGILRL